jgi:hypothetical protein
MLDIQLNPLLLVLRDGVEKTCALIMTIHSEFELDI